MVISKSICLIRHGCLHIWLLFKIFLAKIKKVQEQCGVRADGFSVSYLHFHTLKTKATIKRIKRRNILLRCAGAPLLPSRRLYSCEGERRVQTGGQNCFCVCVRAQGHLWRIIPNSPRITEECFLTWTSAQAALLLTFFGNLSGFAWTPCGQNFAFWISRVLRRNSNNLLSESETVDSFYVLNWESIIVFLF